MKKRKKNYYPPKKEGKASAFWSGAATGFVVALCALGLTVCIAASINGIPAGEQIVSWAGGVMPPAETVTPTV